jgi:hypothetical protein
VPEPGDAGEWKRSSLRSGRQVCGEEILRSAQDDTHNRPQVLSKPVRSSKIPGVPCAEEPGEQADQEARDDGIGKHETEPAVCRQGLETRASLDENKVRSFTFRVI